MHYSNFASLLQDSYDGMSWRAVRFDQDIELVLTGKLIVEISLGDQLQQGGPSAATSYGPAGPLAAGDHLQRDRPHS